MTSAFRDLYEQINEAINNDSVKTEAISKIHPEINTYYNSVNVYVGRQSSGKGFQAITEIIKISKVDKTAHLLIYVSKYASQTDKTFESLKHLIKIPIIYTKYEDKEDKNKDSVQVFSKIMCYKRLYDEIKTKHLEDDIEDEQKQELFETLHINSFESPVLHTLILLDDCANNSLLLPKGFFAEALSVCRHNHTSFFLTIQFFKSINTNIKANLSTIYIFGLFSKQQLQYMLYQISSHYTFDELFDVYKQLQKHDCLIIDTNTGNIKVYQKLNE